MPLGQQRFVVIALVEWRICCEGSEGYGAVFSEMAGRPRERSSLLLRASYRVSGARARSISENCLAGWIIRRLSPDSNPVDITLIPNVHDEETLLHAMGSEAANVHLGTKRQAKNILKHLRRMKPDWLCSAAKSMAKALEQDWKHYKKSGSRKSS